MEYIRKTNFSNVLRSFLSSHVSRHNNTSLLITFGDGFYQDEGGVRWMAERGLIHVSRKGDASRAQTLKLLVSCSQAGYYPIFPLRVDVFTNGQSHERLIFKDGEQTRSLSLTIPANVAQLDISLISECTFKPAALWISDDARMLSVSVSALGFNEFVDQSISSSDAAQMQTWQCNICGKWAQSNLVQFTRETPSCPHCNSSVRMRAVIHALSVELFGLGKILDAFPVSKHLRGAGMSDWHVYATKLGRVFDYTNTFYHQQPKLDLTQLDAHWIGKFDFVICSEVMEHVAQPVDAAFSNLRRLLKPNGILVFTTPYGLQPETWEHFPELWQYRLEKGDDGIVLHNTTRDGRYQSFSRLIFHGGPGSTLEMRMFSLNGLLQAFDKAGFQQPHLWGEDVLENGIHWNARWSLPMTSRPA